MSNGNDNGKHDEPGHGNRPPEPPGRPDGIPPSRPSTPPKHRPVG